MKKNSKYTVWLRAGLFVFVAVAAALVAYAATFDTHKAIDQDVEWFADENTPKINNGNYLPTDQDYFFLEGNGLDYASNGNDRGSYNGRHYYSTNFGTRSLTFEIADGYTAIINVYAANNIGSSNDDGTIRYIRLKNSDGTEIVHKNLTLQSTSTSDKVWTFEFPSIPAGIYTLTGDKNAHFCGIEVKVTALPRPDPSLATIATDYQWRPAKGDKLLKQTYNYQANSTANTYYTYYHGANDVKVEGPGDGKPAIDGIPAYNYNLDANDLSFKVGKGKGTISIYTTEYDNLDLKSGKDMGNVVSVGSLSYTQPEEDNGSIDGKWCSTRVWTYDFVNTEETVYTIDFEYNGVIAGFDVSFDQEDSVDELVPISGDYVWGVNTTAGSQYMAPDIVDGESHFFLQKGTLNYSIPSDGTNMYYGSDFAGCELVFDVEDGRKLDATIYAAAGNGFTITDASGNDVAYTTTTAPYGITNIVFTGLTGGRYTVKGVSGAVFYGIEIKDVTPEDGPLVTIRNYFLWRVGERTINADKYFDNNYLRHNTSDGTTALTPDAANTTRVLGEETPTVILTNNNEITLRLAGGTKGKVNVYYIGENKDLKIMYNGAEDKFDTSINTAVAADDPAQNIEDTSVKTYSFDLKNAGDRIVRVRNGNGSSVRIAAIEVVIDHDIASNAQKNINWYVCDDAKMIAGSERVVGNTEYAEFYVSKGRRAEVCFYMPSITDLLLKKGTMHPNDKYAVTIKNGGAPHSWTFPDLKWKSDGSKPEGDLKSGYDNLWNWMTMSFTINPGKDNTQTWTITATDPLPDENGKISTDDKGNVIGETREWTAVLKFHYIDCPEIIASDGGASATLEMKAAKGYEDYDIFYTTDATDPADRNNPYISNEEFCSTSKYDNADKPVVNVNCLAAAAQYIHTPKPFYTAGPGSETSNVFKLLSDEKYITLAARPDVIYVPSLSNGEEFKKESGKIDELKVDGNTVLRFMYGRGDGTEENAVKFFRLIGGDNTFQPGGVMWKHEDDKGTGYSTYMDPYKYTVAGNTPEGKPFGKSSNANPNTEMNGGIGGADTEYGGMFLQPVAGDFFRLEPEYDGVATIWVRQNGMVDFGNMYDGLLSRRPVYVMDEDGVIQRGSTIKPTKLHHLAVDGVFATISPRNELRSSFAQSWAFGTRSQEAWDILAGRVGTHSTDTWYPQNYEILQLWFDSGIVDITTQGQLSPGSANSLKYAEDINRYSRIGSQMLYRDDWMYVQEKKMRDEKYPGSPNPFARYGYEIPNFGAVKYTIPVKAGKTYYLGGRGTKNGFMAMQFEPLPPNYDNLDYKRIDNPEVIDGVIENAQYYDVDGTNKIIIGGDAKQRASLRWDKATITDADIAADNNNKKLYVPEDAVKAYNGGIKTMTISEDGQYSQWWTWWVPGAKDGNGEPFIYDRGNMLVGTTINVDLVRNFEAGKWYPIVLPFSVSESRMREMFGKNVKVLYLDPVKNSYSDDKDRHFNSVYHPAVKDTQLKFTYHYYQMLYANTPAFICPSEITDNPQLKGKTADGKTVFHFNRVCYTRGEIKTYDIGGGYEVTGSYYPTDKLDNYEKTEMYYISNEKVNGEDKVLMYHSKEGIHMKGTRCWIRPKKGVAHAPIMTMGFGSFSDDGYGDNPGMTGITDVISDHAPATLYDNDNVYDIMGRIVAKGSTAGLPSGVYIFKGKKVYVK